MNVVFLAVESQEVLYTFLSYGYFKNLLNRNILVTKPKSLEHQEVLKTLRDKHTNEGMKITARIILFFSLFTGFEK